MLKALGLVLGAVLAVAFLVWMSWLPSLVCRVETTTSSSEQLKCGAFSCSIEFRSN